MPTGSRDPRLDLVRGVALLTIYVDHIPGNILSYITIGAFGMSDAAEIFVFVSGFSAYLAYGRVFASRGPLAGTLAVARRCWRLFSAHVILVVSLAALVAVASSTISDSDYISRFNFSPLFAETNVAMPRLATLSYMPSTMDILPLYIVLVAVFPIIWWAIRIRPELAIAGSAILWLAAQRFGLGLPNYPEGTWFFNPFAWQLMFTLGAVAASGWAPMRRVAASNVCLTLAICWLAFGLLAAAPWSWLPGWEGARPVSIDTFWMLIAKERLSLARIAHFLALAIVFVRLVPAAGDWTRGRVAHLLIVCGQHGLKVFCISCLIAFVSYVAIDVLHRTYVAQVAISFLGILLLLAVGPVTQRLRLWDQAPPPRTLAAS